MLVGLQIPPNNVVLSDYHERLRAAVEDSHGRIYIDTSVLMWLLRVSLTARQEFLSWCDAPERSERVFVPTWSTHELFHHIRLKTVLNQIQERLVASSTSLNDLLCHADEVCDDLWCKPTAYPNRPAAIERLRLCASEIQSYLDAVKGIRKLEPAYSVAVDEISGFVNRHSTKTDLFGFMEGISSLFENRSIGRIPPGFQDAEKPENAFGDLVFWKEILAHGKDSSSILILSNDVKNDWRHYAQFVQNYKGKDLQHKSVPGAEAQYPHPLLAFEASLAGVNRLNVINTSVFASLLELMKPYSVPLLLSAAYPRGVAETPHPDWAALGVDRPPIAWTHELDDVSFGALRAYSPPPPMKSLFDTLRGSFLDRRQALSDTALPKLLVDEGVLGFVKLGQAVLESAHEIEGAISITDAITSVATISPQRASAMVLGMLIAVYFTVDYEVRPTPLRGVSQTILSMTFTEPYQRPAKKIKALLKANDVWLMSAPPWEGDTVSLSVTLTPGNEDKSKNLESIVVNGMEVLDVASAMNRRLSVLFGSERAQLSDLLKMIAIEFTIPEMALTTIQDVETDFTWDESAGLGIQRTDFQRIVTDVELMLSGGNGND
ncbi:MAG: PIN-like domain-containing protein [Candidatus Pacebacteria bacterium]|nr:PIN-like domain-containing protein [Candidatus Paceibacterota bacterium]